jgi:hypothetical protein
MARGIAAAALLLFIAANQAAGSAVTFKDLPV